MTLEQTQTLKFELEEDDLEDNFSEVSNPAGYLLEISKTNNVKETHIIGRRSVKYIIGRAYTCDIIIDHPSISNKHATLEVENGLLWITDEDSTNYTRIGDEINTATINCHPDRGYQVNSKQYVTLGEVHFQYYNYVDHCARIRDGDSTIKKLGNPIISAPREEFKNEASAAVCDNVVPDFNTTQKLDHINLSDSETENKEREDFAIPQLRVGESVENVFSDDDAERAVNSKDDSCLPETQVFDPCYQELTDEISTQVFDPCWRESPCKNSVGEVVESQKAKSPEATQAFEYSTVYPEGGDNFFAETESIQMKLSEAQPAHFKPCTTISLQNRDEIDLENMGTEQWNGEPSGCEATQAFDINILTFDKENDCKGDGELQCVETQAFDPVFLEEVKEKEVSGNDEPSGNETQAFRLDLLEIDQGKDMENEKLNEISNGLMAKRSVCNAATDQEENTPAVLSPKLTSVEEIKLKGKYQGVIEGKKQIKSAQEQKDQSVMKERMDAEHTKALKIKSDKSNYLGMPNNAKLQTKRNQQSENYTKINLNMLHNSENVVEEMKRKTYEVKNNQDILESSCGSQSSSDSQKKNITQSATKQYSELDQRRMDELADDGSDLTTKKLPKLVCLDEVKQETTIDVGSLELQQVVPEEKASVWPNSQLHLDSRKPEPSDSTGDVVQQDKKSKEESILSHEPRPQVISMKADVSAAPPTKKPHPDIIGKPLTNKEVLKQQISTSLLANGIVIKDKGTAQQQCTRSPGPEFRPVKSQPNPCSESNEIESVGGLVPTLIPLVNDDGCHVKFKSAEKSMKWSDASKVLESQSLSHSGKSNVPRAISTNKNIIDIKTENIALGVSQEIHQYQKKENNRKSRDPQSKREANASKVLLTPTILRKPLLPRAPELVPEMSEIKAENVNKDKVKDNVISEMKAKSRVEKISRKAKPKKIADKGSALNKRKKYSRMLQKKKARKSLSSKASKSERKSKSASKNPEPTTTKVQAKTNNKVTQKISRKKRKLPVARLTVSRKKRRASNLQKPYILRTGVSDAAQEKSLTKIGATFLSTVDRKVTHLCMDKFRTTEKVLCGLAYCDYVVSSKWLSKCLTKGNFMVEEAKFNIPSDASLKQAERDLGFKLSDVISRRNRKHSKLFQGLKLFMTNKVHPAFGRMFSAHGGTLAKTSGRKYNPDVIVLGLQEADDDAQKLVKKKFRVRTTSWIKAAIFRQKLPKVCEFRVKQIVEDLRSSYGDFDNILRRRSRRRETMGKVFRSIS